MRRLVNACAASIRAEIGINEFTAELPDLVLTCSLVVLCPRSARLTGSMIAHPKNPPLCLDLPTQGCVRRPDALAK